MDIQPVRKLVRLKDFDYRQSGLYFLTICSFRRSMIFGQIKNNQLEASLLGQLVRECWEEIPSHFPFVQLDAFVVMPNHLHGIIGFVSEKIPNELNVQGRSKKGSLGSVVGSFKAAVSRVYRANNKVNNPQIWQRGYFEHVIRNENALDRIREYIVENPYCWDMDQDNPEAKKSDANFVRKML